MNSVKNRKWPTFVVMGYSILLFVIAVVIVAVYDLKETSVTSVAEVTYSIMGISVGTTILASTAFDRRRKNVTDKLFVVLMCLQCTMLFICIAGCYLVGNPKTRVLYVATQTLFYVVGLLMQLSFYLFTCYVESNATNTKMRIFATAITALGILNFLLNLGFKHIFYIDDAGYPVKTKTYLAWTLFSGLLIVLLLIQIWCLKKIRNKIILLGYIFLPLLAELIKDLIGGLNLQPMVTLLGLVLIYTSVYTSRGRQLAEQERRLKEQQLQLMVSQVQPHFMFNALTSIIAMCEDEEVSSILMDFSQYLRMNVDSISNTAPIPFEKEITHTKQYLRIEKLRFDERLSVVYDVEDADFKIPALTIQPIVENAVKHGICKKREGGTVTISAYDNESEYLIEVADDGVGFDVNEAFNDGKTHTGISNVRERIRNVCGGELTIESQPGLGTTVTLHIPKEWENSANNSRG